MNYRTPTCSETIVSSSGSSYSFPRQVRKLSEDDTIVTKPVGAW